ncbi:cation transporter, partial [Staphylococcus aureus]|uniref:cation transporter n=1 Tax=Staphylococcus aureus TaxID=1280 RepID=UPI000F3E426E
AACSNRIEKVLNKTSGVKQANVNLTTEQAAIDYYLSQTDVDTLIGRIQNLGYNAQPKQTEEQQASRKEKELKHKRNKLIVSAVLALPLLMTMLVHLFNMNLPHILMNPWFQLILATPIQFIIGAACSNRIEKVLNKTSGVKQANVNLTTEQAAID